MAGELARLGITVDAKDAVDASKNLDQLSASAAKAERATDSLAKTSTKATASLRSAGASSTSSINGLSKAQEQYIALVKAGIPIHQRYIDAIGGAVEAEKLLAATTKAISASSQVAAASAKALGAAHAGMSTQSMAAFHALRSMAEGLAAGIPPSQILAQQINHLSFAASGQGGLTGAFKGALTMVKSLLSPMVILGGGLAGLAVAFGVVTVAAEKSAEANSKFDAALSGIGRAGGATLDDIRRAMESTAKAQEGSAATAEDWARTYATAGKASGDILVGLTGITKQFADATGQDAAGAVKELAEAFADPAKGAETLNNQLGFLNATQLKHIQQLSEEGDRLGAQKALYADLNKALDETAKVHVTGLIAAWQGVAKWAENAWHAMVVWAGGGDLLDNLIAAQARLKADMKDFGSSTLPGYVAQINADKKAVAEAEQAYAKFNDTIAKGNKQQAANDNSIKAQPILDKIFPDESKLQALRKDYETLADAQKAAAAAGENPAQYQTITAGMKVVQDAINRVTDAYNKYGGSAGVAHEIALLQAQAAGTTSNAEKGEIQTKIHLLQTLGDLTPAQQLFTAAQDAGRIVADKVHKTTDSVITSYNEHMQSLRDLTKLQNDLNAKVESGAISTEDALKQAKLQKELEPQIVKIMQDGNLTADQRKEKIDALTASQIAYNDSLDKFSVDKVIEDLNEQAKLAGMTADQREREAATLQVQHKLNGTLHGDALRAYQDAYDHLQLQKQIGNALDGMVTDADEFPDGFTDKHNIQISTQLEEILS